MSPKGWRGDITRHCLCGAAFVINYTHRPGRTPKIIYYHKACKSCGRYLKDPSRRRGGDFDPRYERGYGSQFL